MISFHFFQFGRYICMHFPRVVGPRPQTQSLGVGKSLHNIYFGSETRKSFII